VPLLRAKISINTLVLPTSMPEWIHNAAVYESSGESGAQTVFIDARDGFYLKIAGKGQLQKASQMQHYLADKGLSAPVCLYLSEDRDYMLTKALAGNDGTFQGHLAEPARLSEAFGQALRHLHEMDFTDCPVQHALSWLLTVSKDTAFRQSHLDILSNYVGNTEAANAGTEIEAKKHILQNDVLLHGDYCLPNILLNDWHFSGFIDVAEGGVGDRHYDLAWGLWTLCRNLKTPAYGQRFLDAYGRDWLDEERLRVCALLAALD